jgi:hypothetical protein
MHTTYHIPLTTYHSNEEIMKVVFKGMIEEGDPMGELQCRLLDNDDILYINGCPFLRKAKYRLDHIGLEGLKLTCLQLGPPQKLGNMGLHTICYTQHNDGQLDLFKPLKTTTLTRVEVEAFTVIQIGDIGSNFTNALLQYLPPTLTELSLKGVWNFNVPCTFPPCCNGLTWLLLKGANFKHNNLSNCLPEGLLYLHIDVNEMNEYEFEGFEFGTFDCTGLPSTLTTLVFNGVRSSASSSSSSAGPLELVGTLPPSLKELVLPEKENVDLQPSMLPEGCTVRREDDDYFCDGDSDDDDDVDDDSG